MLQKISSGHQEDTNIQSRNAELERKGVKRTSAQIYYLVPVQKGECFYRYQTLNQY
jgi:hypothetical protein